MDVNILVVPSFHCDRKCKYCMFRSLTDQSPKFNLRKLIDNTADAVCIYKKLPDRGKVTNVSVGNGGDIGKLDRTKIIKLIEYVKTFGSDTSLLINLDENVVNDDRLFQLSQTIVSINQERPFNNRIIELINKLRPDIRSNLTIVMVLLNSLYKADITETLQFINDLNIKQVTFNAFDSTCYNEMSNQPDIHMFYDWLLKVFEQYNKQQYNFKITNFEMITQPESIDRIGTVDIYVTDHDFKVFVGHGKNKQLLSIDPKTIELEQLDDLLHSIGSQTIVTNKQCLNCKHYNRCDGKLYLGSDDHCLNIFNSIDQIYNTYGN